VGCRCNDGVKSTALLPLHGYDGLIAILKRRPVRPNTTSS
jgi:hypothetical protein